MESSAAAIYNSSYHASSWVTHTMSVPSEITGVPTNSNPGSDTKVSDSKLFNLGASIRDTVSKSCLADIKREC